MGRFSWLHLNDLQVGDDDTWPPIWDALCEDLERIHTRAGPWDVVVLCGDLTQHGRQQEYERLNEYLERLWTLFQSLGSNPVLIAVPGDQDQEFPPPEGPGIEMLRRWVATGSVPEGFWSGLSTPARDSIEQAWSHYRHWSGSFPFPRPQKIQEGLLPGDFATTFDCGGRKIGIAGLNTAFLQLGAEDHSGRLAVDKRQAEAVFRGNVHDWAATHDVRLLLTHHPPSWLNADAMRQLHEDIAPAHSFHLHLCSSQHERPPVFLLDREGPRTATVQLIGLSLTGKIPRDMSEKVGFISGIVEGESELKFRCFPRMMKESRYSTTRFGPDPNFGTNANEEWSLDLGHIHATLERRPRSGRESTLLVSKVEIRNFRNLEHLTIDLDRPSSLPGHWTCIAGVNGSGKTSVLQALCLVCLGERLVPELGGGRLERMRRRSNGARLKTEIRAWIRRDGVDQTNLVLDGREISSTDTLGWQKPLFLLMAYGATRNLSEYVDSRHSNLSTEVQRQMTLFDPLTQVAHVKVVLEKKAGDGRLSWDFRELLCNCLNAVFEGELTIEIDGNLIGFKVDGEVVDAVDLPDGYRSSVAWLADLCATWAESGRSGAATTRPEDIEALVLIDEIDLHLHPSLQRKLIHRLRRALPRVQWIVTTHSPLVLSNFDTNEIILLDNRSPDGVRVLDRQILGFSSDEVYQYLMDTPPTSAEMDEVLKSSPERVPLLMEMSPEANEDEAKRRRDERREFLASLSNIKP